MLNYRNPIKRIVILRALSGLGDFLCVVPAWRSLRAAFPEAEIVLVGLASVKPLVERFHHYIDRLLVFPGYPGLPEVPAQLEKIPSFLTNVQNKNFDLAIQMHGSGIITNPITMLFGAKINAGFFLPNQYCPDENSFLIHLANQSEIRRYLRLLEFLGIPSQGEELEFPLKEEDKQALLAIEKVRDLNFGEYICLHPGASTPTRCWSPAGFAEVADALAALGLSIVLTGSQQEIQLTEKVASMMKFPSINLAGCTNIGALAVLLQNARLLICNDTGISHLAAALRVPSVVIFSQSDPQIWAPLDRQRHRIVRHTTDITKQAVITQAKDLLRSFPTSQRQQITASKENIYVA